MNKQTLDHIAATAQLMGMTMTAQMLAVIAGDLSRFADSDIVQACNRLRLEGGRFEVSKIIGNLPGGHPEPEQAWAAIPLSEHESGCVTAEIMDAWGQVQHLDKVAARMAFKEIYLSLIADKKMNGDMPKWFITCGTDSELREQAVLAAAKRNRITAAYAHTMLPYIPANDFIALADGRKNATQLLEDHSKRLDDLNDEPEENMPTSKKTALRHIAEMRKMLADEPEGNAA